MGVGVGVGVGSSHIVVAYKDFVEDVVVERPKGIVGST